MVTAELIDRDGKFYIYEYKPEGHEDPGVFATTDDLKEIYYSLGVFIWFVLLLFKEGSYGNKYDTWRKRWNAAQGCYAMGLITSCFKLSYKDR